MSENQQPEIGDSPEYPERHDPERQEATEPQDPERQEPAEPAAAASVPQRYPFWDYSDIAIFIGLAIPSMLLSELLVRGFLVAFHLHPAVKVLELLPAQFLMYLLLFGGLLAIFRLKYERPFWSSLAWRDMRLPFSLVMAAGMATAFAVGIASSLIHTPQTSTPMTELMQGRLALILVAIFGVTLGPLFEELAFRGFLQPLLVRSLGGPAGVLLAAVPFGILHYPEYGNSWRHVVVISLAGAAFGAMRQLTGSTKAAVLMHAAYNSFFFIVLFARKDQP